MKKLLIILLILASAISFSKIYFTSPDVLIYPNRTIYFRSNEQFYVQVFRFNINKNVLQGILYGDMEISDFTLKKQSDDVYKIILPDIPGAYYVLVKGGKNAVNNLFFLTHFEAFVASSKKQLFFSVYDLKNKRFINKLYYYDKNLKKTLTGPIFNFDIERYKSKVFFIDNNVVFLSKYGGWSSYPEKKAIVFTDKPIYKPGDIIHFRVNLFKRSKDKYIPYPSTVTISLKDPFNNIIYSNTFKTDEYGGAVFDYKTTSEIITGNYTVIVKENNDVISWFYFLIQDYTKPTYTITLTPSSTQIVAGNTLQVKLKATYLNGDPVKNAEVLFYGFLNTNLINKMRVVTDNNGEAVYYLHLDKPGMYKIQALVVDDSGKQYDKKIYVEAKADNVNIESKIENNILKLYITDLSGNPLNGIGVVTINDVDSYFKVLNGRAEIEIPKNVWKVTVKFGKEIKNIFTRYSRGESGILTADKMEVKLGETVNITVEPKNDVGILVTGAEQIRDFILITKKQTVTIKIPNDEIAKSYFVQFYGLKSYDLLNIKIKHNRVKKLNIVLNKSVYKPGEFVNVAFEKSKSLKIVSVVDEGLYLISNPPSVLENLYPEHPYPDFDVYKSIRYIYFGSLSKFEKNIKSHIFASTKETSERRIRDYFPETAYWNPKLYENEFSFKAPDSITKWRVTAYEISKDYIAEGNINFVVTKPFEIKIFVPDFLTVGDNVNGLLYIKNYTGNKGKVEVKLSAENVEMINFESGTFYIEKDLKIPFKIKVSNEGTATITAEASMLNEYDGIKISIPIQPQYFEKNISKIIKINGEKIFNKEDEIRIINNIKDILKPSIKALIKYPYGCVEQTMSSFYPALVAKKFVEYPNLDDIILKGLQRLLKFQHRDGGWGWWMNDESSVFMTSYVLEGLYYTKLLGYYFPNEVIENAIIYLKKQKLNGYSAFVLNLFGEKVDFQGENIIDYVYTSPEKIREYAIEDNDKAYIKGTGFYSNVQLTSIAIRTLSRNNKYLDLRDKMINYLLSMKRGPFWYSTKDTALSVLAIIESQDFEKYKSNLIIEENEKNIIVKGNGYVEVKSIEKIHSQNVSNGIKIQNELFKRYEVLFDDKYIDAFLPLDSKYIPVSISYTSTPTFFSPIPDDISKIIHGGTPVSFSNNNLVIEGPFKFIGNDYYFEDGFYSVQFAANQDFEIHKGDFLKTVINIDGKGEYLIVEEYLPACAQVIKNYSEKTPDYYGKFSYQWYEDYNLWYSYQDLKKDKIAFFIRYLNPGKLNYYWRVTYNGTFVKKPTYIFNMYYEDTFAIGSLDTFIIK
ncbi:MG2 domain-containing protein [Thermosipho atlanticus]|uniref:Alpha-2-macroglobulin family N-terminal region n=1 Tax=Thermosipho atlanticus DSM 15807 TaxID=1123380 RepID=A0A1M5RR21_9BACT|nr:MG2 domain-containing protein [Thermosipho atlanticus]SHH28620.1 hypothetical protein SAMN02745199_0564 [Thermosipho atlanticus DSM 15807]